MPFGPELITAEVLKPLGFSKGSVEWLGAGGRETGCCAFRKAAAKPWGKGDGKWVLQFISR
jgi:hypothetical protein